jgi:hypothetical protein
MNPPRTRDRVGVLVCNQALANASVQSPKLLLSPSPSLSVCRSVCLSLCDSRAQNQNCSYMCVCGRVGGEQTVCDLARTQNNEAGIENPTQSAAAERPKRAKANLRAWGSAAPPHKWFSRICLSVCLCERDGGRERGSVFVCTGDSSIYYHYYDHFITGFQQQIKHNNTQNTNQKASVMFSRKKNNKHNSKDARSQERLLPRHKRRSQKRRRPTRATSAVKWWIPEPILIIPASGMYLLHTYLPTYRCLEYVPFGIF